MEGRKKHINHQFFSFISCEFERAEKRRWPSKTLQVLDTTTFFTLILKTKCRKHEISCQTEKPHSGKYTDENIGATRESFSGHIFSVKNCRLMNATLISKNPHCASVQQQSKLRFFACSPLLSFLLHTIFDKCGGHSSKCQIKQSRIYSNVFS